MGVDGGEIEYTAKLSRAAFAAGAGTELGNISLVTYLVIRYIRNCKS